MKFVRMIWILLTSLALVNCASRSEMGAVVGGASATAGCVKYVSDNPYVAGVCAIAGAFVGAEALYNDDYDVHNAQFVDHLNHGGSDVGYTNWSNSETGNSGTIRVTRTYLKGPLKCKEYDSTVDINKSFPLMGYGDSSPHREVTFGRVCQAPDGRWFDDTK